MKIGRIAAGKSINRGLSDTSSSYVIKVDACSRRALLEVSCTGKYFL